MNKLLFICFSLLVSCNSSKKRPLQGLTNFQKELNAEYKDASKSPLKKEDLRNFKGLDFFPINDTLQVKATLTVTPNTNFIPVKTTTDRITYKRVYGVLNFTIKDENYQLNVYQDRDLMSKEGYEDYLFLPFTDETNGQTSYGGGRYIDLRIPKETLIVELDFNKAYNPYCAYNSAYSCPLVPYENDLKIPINAGVKVFNK